ncbi:MAG: molybdate ABC transporter substrate-binding protein [Mycobacterium sp.]
MVGPATGCGTNDGHAPDGLVIFAAASLHKPFTEVSRLFTEANRGARVEVVFAGSTDLLTQLTQGAEADIYASADTPTMDRAAAAGLLGGEPVALATNTLTIAVAPGNPKAIKSFQDLRAVSVVICAPQVPCGAALPRLQRETGVDLAPVSEESSVTDVLNRVTSTTADAGLVYVTDALAATGDITAVAFPEAASAVNTYRIATLLQSRRAALATEFVEFMTGPVGRETLASAGFGSP